MKGVFSVFFAAIALVSLQACSSRPPFLKSEPTIQLVIEGASPKWHELTRRYMPRRINRRANANVVSHQPIPSPSYTLTLSFYDAEREITGSKSSGLGAGGGLGGGIIVGGQSKSKVLSKTTIEATSTLTDASGKIVWSWVGFAEHKTAGHAVEAMADKIAKELVRHRLIEPNLKPLEH